MKHRIAILLAFLMMTCFSQCFAEIVANRGIEIRIQGVDPNEKGRIDGLYTVSGAGVVRMPMVGDINVGGMTANAAAVKIETAYKTAGIYTTATFQIIDSKATSDPREDMVTIAGFVRTPGPKNFTPGLTLFQAIAAAGGVNEFGDLKRVRLMRGNNVQDYDMNVLENRNIPLQANDTIELIEKSINPFKR
jgi:protein involved in polysaccharide export with SLBB domain